MYFIKESTIFLLLLLNTIVFANIDDGKIYLNELYQRIPHAIDRIEGADCFLKSESIVFNQGLVYVEEQGQWVSFPMICFTQNGIYIPTNSTPRPNPIWTPGPTIMNH